jgi:hypothetical protein
MKKTASILKFATFVLGLMFSAMFIQSCGEDDIEGCMDAAAENYNAEATVDNGTCEFARDKFLGSYIGSLTCPGLLGGLINSDALPFTITEGLGSDVAEVLINLQGTIPVTFSGTASGNSVAISTLLEGLPIDLDGDLNPESVSLQVGGNFSITGSDLTGTVSIQVVAPIMLPTEDCAITGTKQ